VAQQLREIRDPIHVFIRLDPREQEVLDSRPLQRLRYIHQLATTYLVYPGATHRRFEHSLGVMELASRIYDVITRKEIADKKIQAIIADADARGYWRRVLRMAALCHDTGHLPFSHAAEDELLPKGWNHERISVELIKSDDMQRIWRAERPTLEADDIAKLAVGRKDFSRMFPDVSFSDWEDLLAEIITGSAFGADRMDYLLRDSYHAGVAYGGFDHFRLIDTLCILPGTDENEGRPTLGIEQDGLRSVEALLLARYYMFSQLYLHRVRRIYDIHLKDFLKEWLPSGQYSIDLEQHLRMTDDEVLVAIRQASNDVDGPGYSAARRILNREHFRRVYEPNASDTQILPAKRATEAVYNAMLSEFSKDNVRCDSYAKETEVDFQVLSHDGSVAPCLHYSELLNRVPQTVAYYVFVAPELLSSAERWLRENRNRIIVQQTL